MKNETISKKEDHVILLLSVNQISVLFLTVILSILIEYPFFPKFFLDQIALLLIFVGFYFVFHFIKNLELIKNILCRPINRLLQIMFKKFPPPMNL